MKYSTCIICLDTIETIPSIYDIYVHIYLIFSNKYHYYWKPCNCKIIAHRECIQKWYNHTPTCPYCKNSVYEIQYILTPPIIYYPTVKKLVYYISIESTFMIINCINMYLFIDAILYIINCR